MIALTTRTTMNPTNTRQHFLPSTKVSTAFEKEAELIAQIKSGEIERALLLWRASDNTLVLPANKKWQSSPALLDQLSGRGWQLYSRRTGGAPVPQTPGVINVSQLFLWDKGAAYGIERGYQEFCARLEKFFKALGLATAIHATPGAYCDGDYNLNINGQKIVGTAQRVMANSRGQKIVLAQACILVAADLDKLIEPVNLCNAFNQHKDRVRANAHTCLRNHLDTLPSTEALFEALADAFS